MPQPTVALRNWGDAVFLAIANAVNMLLTAIPLVIGALIILAIGWILSGILARLTTAALQRAGADRLFAAHGARAYGDAAQSVQPSVIGGEIVKWLIRLVFLIAACNTLGLTQVSTLLNSIVLWIPNLIVAAVILLVAPVIGKFVRGIIEAGARDLGFTNGRLLGRLADYAIVAFAVLIAVNQIGIAQNLIDIAFMGLVAALAIAFGLAFGLGGRDVAARLTEQWYEQSRSTAQRVADQQRPTVDGRRMPAGGLVPGASRARPE